MNRYYEFIIYCFNEWLRDPEGMINISKWDRNYLSMFSHFFELTPEVQLIKVEVKKIISDDNLFLLDIMKELSILFETGKFNNGNYDDLKRYRENINLKHNHFKKQINGYMTKLLLIAESQIKVKSVISFS
jgi:hypothetical protein